MAKKKQIVESHIEPNKDNLWLDSGVLKVFGNNGWEAITDILNEEDRDKLEAIDTKLELKVIRESQDEETVKDSNTIYVVIPDSQILIEYTGAVPQLLINSETITYPKSGEPLIIKEPLTSCQGMFSNVERSTQIQKLNLEYLDTSKVISFKEMFNNFSGSSSLKFPKLKVGNVTDISRMFDSSKFTELDLSNLQFDLNKITNVSYLCAMMENLKSIKFASCDFKNAENVSVMFSDCINLKEIITPYWNFEKARDLSRVFYECENLKKLDLTNCKTDNAETMWGMFSCCYGLTELDLSSFNTKKVRDFGDMFSNTSNLISLDISSFDTSSAVNMANMFEKCTAPLDVSHFNAENVTEISWMFTHNTSEILDVSNWKVKNIEHAQYAFSYMPNLKSIKGLNTWDMSKCTDMRHMFYNNPYLEELDLSNWDTSKVMFFNNMFIYNTNLKTLNIKGWNYTQAIKPSYDLTYGLGALKNLTTLIGPIYKIKYSITLAESSLLTRESCLVVLNGLFDYCAPTDRPTGFPGTVKFHPDAKARLTPEDIAIASMKGWSII